MTVNSHSDTELEFMNRFDVFYFIHKHIKNGLDSIKSIKTLRASVSYLI